MVRQYLVNPLTCIVSVSAALHVVFSYRFFVDTRAAPLLFSLEQTVSREPAAMLRHRPHTFNATPGQSAITIPEHRMNKISLSVNGRTHAVTVDADTPLLYVLRDNLNLKGPRFGCGLSQCGACTVIIDGAAVRSCVYPVSTAKGHKITTLEGLGSPAKPDPLQQAFIDEQAVQCGYCINGMIMQSADFLAKNKNPTEPQIKEALANNLCRCGTHLRIVRAVKRAAANL
jgi:nicotinate dehydrogenase subunit A